MGTLMIPIIMLGVMLLFGAIFWIVINSKAGKKMKAGGASKVTDAESEGKEKTENAYKKNPNAAVNKEDVFKFMEFDKIEDNMVIQQGGTKFTAILKCKGINYALMSEIEQLAVEEGFITFLNTLKSSVQLYVQAQTIDLKESVRKYRENMQGLGTEYEDKSTEYNMLVNSLESTDEEIEKLEETKNSIQNVMDYGNDIIRYVEKLSTNKSMLQRSFYVLVSYYAAEISVGEGFKKDEIAEICYNELYTRVQSITSGLASCSVASEVMDSNAIAELLYSAYNRDDKNYINVKQALESGFHRLYSTSIDAIQKKNDMLIDGMKKEAEYKAISALAKAVEEGNYISPEMAEDIYDQETSRQAVDMVKNERIDEETKKKAKNIIVEEYKKGKHERIEKIKQQQAEAQKIVGKVDDKKQEAEEAKNIPTLEELEKDKENIIEDMPVNDIVSNAVVEDNNSDDSIV